MQSHSHSLQNPQHSALQQPSNKQARKKETGLNVDRSVFLQTKLTVNTPGDRYEREADAVADRIMRMPNGAALTQPSLTPVQGIQRKCAACEEEEETLQRKEHNSNTIASPAIASQLAGSQGKGRPLPGVIQGFMSRAIGADFSGVRVHTDSAAAQMNQQLNARAFTYGSDIYFNRGEYDPDSAPGKRLLGHELAHVVQQGADKPAIQRQDAAASPRIEHRYGLGMRGRYGIYDAELNHDTRTLTLVMRVNFNFTGAWPSVAEQVQWQQDFISQVTTRWSYRFYLVPDGSCSRPEMDQVHFARVRVIPTATDPHYNINVAYATTHQDSSINSLAGTGTLDSLDTVERERTHDGVTYRQRGGEHEFGHMLGLPHIECDTTQQSCPGGYGDEHAERRDVMGSGWIVSARNYAPFTSAMYYFSGCNWRATQSMP